VSTNVLLIKDSALPGNVLDIKRSSAPTDSISAVIKRTSSCKSIVYENNEPSLCNHDKKSQKVIMSKNKSAMTPSMFKSEFKTQHLNSSRKALLF